MKRTKMYICAFSRTSLREFGHEFTIVAENYKRFSNPLITQLINLFFACPRFPKRI